MARFLLTSDWHCRKTNPQYRVDDYCESILKKIKWLVAQANKYKVPMIVAGDLFHNVKVPIKVVNRLIRILKKCDRDIYATAGQHDQEFHSEDLISSPFQTLVEAEVIIPLGATSTKNIWGINWNQDLPENMGTDNDSILVMHYTVTNGDPAFFLQDSGMSSDDVLDSFPEFRYIVCGDYHTPHIKKRDGRILINCGCIGRSNKDQYNFQPQAYLLDTGLEALKVLKIPIDPPENVFKIPEDMKVMKDDVSIKIENIIKSMTSETERPNFITTVRVIMQGEKCSNRQKEIAEKFYKEAMDV